MHKSLNFYNTNFNWYHTIFKLEPNISNLDHKIFKLEYEIPNLDHQNRQFGAKFYQSGPQNFKFAAQDLQSGTQNSQFVSQIVKAVLKILTLDLKIFNFDLHAPNSGARASAIAHYESSLIAILTIISTSCHY